MIGKLISWVVFSAFRACPPGFNPLGIEDSLGEMPEPQVWQSSLALSDGGDGLEDSGDHGKPWFQ
jgi:hypothetical protein